MLIKYLQKLLYNGPYSLLVRASYFISFSVHARFASAIFTICKWRWWCRNILVGGFLATDQPKNKASDVPCILK